MGKSYKKRSRKEDYDDGEDSYEEVFQRALAVDRRKKKRIARAIKIKDIDTLLEEDIDWLD